MRNVPRVSTVVLAALAIVAAGCAEPAGNQDVLKDADIPPATLQQPETPAAQEPEDAVAGDDIPSPDAEDVDARPRRRARMDADGDGVITYDEAVAVHPDMTVEEFNAWDTNNDGVWDLEEARGFREERRRMFEGRGPRDGQERMGEGRGPRDGRGAGGGPRDGRGAGGGRRDTMPQP